MFKRLQHIIVSVMLLFSITQTMAQIAMPDTVCAGTNRIYRVNNAAVPSTYTWKIDGVTQTTITNSIMLIALIESFETTLAKGIFTPLIFSILPLMV